MTGKEMRVTEFQQESQERHRRGADSRKTRSISGQGNGVKNTYGVVPTLAQWVNNLTTAAQVAAEVWIQFLAQHSELKNPVFAAASV